MPTKQTDFGLVDREVLERLREEYDTMQILHAVDRLDQARNVSLGARAGQTDDNVNCGNSRGPGATFSAASSAEGT